MFIFLHNTIYAANYSFCFGIVFAACSANRLTPFSSVSCCSNSKNQSWPQGSRLCVMTVYCSSPCSFVFPSLNGHPSVHMPCGMRMVSSDTVAISVHRIGGSLSLPEGTRGGKAAGSFSLPNKVVLLRHLKW